MAKEVITADRFNNLKARVKAECLRRYYADNGESVSVYGDDAYDYSVVPATGKTLKQEHRDKLAIPLRAINSGEITTETGEKIQIIAEQSVISDADMTAMEAFTTILETRDILDDTGTDCMNQCAGLCYGWCVESCTDECSIGCSENCTEGCGDECDYNCGADCTGACGGNCSEDCADYCGFECENACSDQCTDGCNTTCMLEEA